MYQFKNKHLWDFYIKIAKLMGVELVKFEDEHTKLLKVEDKVDLFWAYSQIIKEQIQVKEKKMEMMQKEMKRIDNAHYEFWETKDEYLRTKKEKLDLEVDYLAKQDFIGHYEGRKQLYREYHKELTKKADEEMIPAAKELKRLMSKMPEGSKDEARAAGLIHRLVNGQHTIYTRNTLFTEIEEAIMMFRKYDEPQQEKKEVLSDPNDLSI